MDRIGSAIIDFTEAAYDLERSDEDWLPTMMRRGLPVLDHGLGVAGIEYGRPPEGGPIQISRIHVASGPKHFAEKHMAALAATPPDLLRDQARPGQAATMSQNSKSRPEALALYTSHVDYCEDVLGITTVDCRGSGAAIVAPLREVTTLNSQDAQRWQMLAAHVDAGHRLRRGIAGYESCADPQTDLPHDAEAIFDTNGFRLTAAAGKAQKRTTAEKLREAAVAVDCARGEMRDTAPDAALEMWKALVQGRWSMVDWFDTDGRRFVLAVPNAPDVTDPRGLSERQSQVVTYAVMGHTNKMIAYRLGLSPSRVSTLLRDAMHKLGVRTRAQLVTRLHDFQSLG